MQDIKGKAPALFKGGSSYSILAFSFLSTVPPPARPLFQDKKDRHTPTTFHRCFFSFQRKTVFQSVARSSDLRGDGGEALYIAPSYGYRLKYVYHYRNCIVRCLCFCAVLVRLRRVRGVSGGDRSCRSSVPPGHRSETLKPYRFVPFTFTPSVR